MSILLADNAVNKPFEMEDATGARVACVRMSDA